MYKILISLQQIIYLIKLNNLDLYNKNRNKYKKYKKELQKLIYNKYITLLNRIMIYILKHNKIIIQLIKNKRIIIKQNNLQSLFHFSNIIKLIFKKKGKCYRINNQNDTYLKRKFMGTNYSKKYRTFQQNINMLKQPYKLQQADIEKQKLKLKKHEAQKCQLIRNMDTNTQQFQTQLQKYNFHQLSNQNIELNFHFINFDVKISESKFRVLPYYDQNQQKHFKSKRYIILIQFSLNFKLKQIPDLLQLLQNQQPTQEQKNKKIIDNAQENESYIIKQLQELIIDDYQDKIGQTRIMQKIKKRENNFSQSQSSLGSKLQVKKGRQQWIYDTNLKFLAILKAVINYQNITWINDMKYASFKIISHYTKKSQNACYNHFHDLAKQIKINRIDTFYDYLCQKFKIQQKDINKIIVQTKSNLKRNKIFVYNNKVKTKQYSLPINNFKMIDQILIEKINNLKVKISL